MLSSIVALSMLIQAPTIAASAAVSSESAVAAVAENHAPAWKTLATLPFTWIHDLSFASGKVGFAAAENGLVLKTVDGGENWTPVLNLGYPYYWNGVQALNGNDVVITGFFNDPNNPQALIRWSHDGGATWSDDLVLGGAAPQWVDKVHFWNDSLGFTTSIIEPVVAYRTTSGGLQPTDWSASVIDSSANAGWFGTQFSALPNGHVRISGITFCESLDFAASWQCRPSIDAGSDWATFFLDDKRGWVGGGWISEPMTGYVHLTKDGGKTWSERTLEGPWMIHSIIFVDHKNGWAAGGAGDAGGVYVSDDGGESWKVELDAGVGLQVCATADYHIFCAGWDNSTNSHIYSRDFDHIKHDNFDGTSVVQ